MVYLVTISKAQRKLREKAKERRLRQGLTQKGLAIRAGVSLPTLRKFEQKGLISLESFLKLLMALGCLEDFVRALESNDESYGSIDDVLKGGPQKPRQRGWRS